MLPLKGTELLIFYKETFKPCVHSEDSEQLVLLPTQLNASAPPMHAVAGNMRGHRCAPTAHQTSALRQVFMTFFSRMFFVFFSRTLPHSSSAKPHCACQQRGRQAGSAATCTAHASARESSCNTAASTCTAHASARGSSSKQCRHMHCACQRTGVVKHTVPPHALRMLRTRPSSKQCRQMHVQQQWKTWHHVAYGIQRSAALIL